MTARQRRRIVAAALAAPLLFTACGSDSNDTDSAGTSPATSTTGMANMPGMSSSGGASAAGPDTVTLKLLDFTPATLRVKSGTKVTWVNGETIRHTVTSGKVIGVDSMTGLRSGQKPDGKFDETLATTGDEFSFTFDTPGTYQYYCSIHQGMNAEVVVTK